MGNNGGLTAGQRAILAEGQYTLTTLSEEDVVAIGNGDFALADVGDDQLVEFLQAVNLLYRGGEPLISDALYDFTFLPELARRRPDHPFLNTVEPEALIEAKTVELPVRMLSTEKAYDFSTVAGWAKRIEKAAGECDIDFGTLIFRVMPKLDGFAAYDDGQTLYTRGDGRRGTDITRVFARGLQVAAGGRRGLGAGEIVVSRSYFHQHLAHLFDNSRNFQASLIKEKELETPGPSGDSFGPGGLFSFLSSACQRTDLVPAGCRFPCYC